MAGKNEEITLNVITGLGILIVGYYLFKSLFCCSGCQHYKCNCHHRRYRRDDYESDPYITPSSSVASLNLTCRILRDGRVFKSLLNNFDLIDGDKIAVISSDDNNKVIRKTIEDSLSNREYIAKYVEANIASKGLTLSKNYADHMIYLEPALVDESDYPLGYWYFVRQLKLN